MCSGVKTVSLGRAILNANSGEGFKGSWISIAQFRFLESRELFFTRKQVLKKTDLKSQGLGGCAQVLRGL